MKITLDTAAYLDAAAQLIEQGKENIPVPVKGSSMKPFLSEGDTVYLVSASCDIRRGDIVLYRRANGRYVLHRVCSLEQDGSAEMLGDAQVSKETLPDRSSFVGLVSFCIRKGRKITRNSLRWRVFAAVWLNVIPLRSKIMRAAGLFGRSKHRSDRKNGGSDG